MKRLLRSWLYLVVLLPLSCAVFASEENNAESLIAAARELAAQDTSGALDGALFLCQDFAASSRHIMSFEKSLPATKVFDNLYFVGTEFVGVWILETDAGFILFDAMGSPVEAAKYILGGFAKLGLDPSQIRYIVVTHGHWDHYGGARFLQSKFPSQVVMGKPDWDMFARLDERGPELMGQIPPRRDIEVSQPRDLVLGDATVKLRLTPGHSPGTVSALVPVTSNGRRHLLALWGGTAMPPTLAPSEPEIDHTWHNLGLRQYQQSLHLFSEWAQEQGADGVISTHPFSENTIGRLAKLEEESPEEHPFVIGREGVKQYFQVIDYCARASEVRARESGPSQPDTTAP